MKASFLEYGIGCGIMALDALVLWVLARNKLAKCLPAVCALVAFDLVRTGVELYALYAWSRFSLSYFLLYWSDQVIWFVLAYLLVCGFWKAALQGYAGVWRLSRHVLVFALMVVLVVIRYTTLFGQGTAPKAEQWLNDWWGLIGRSVMLTQVVFLLAFFLVVGFFRIRLATAQRRLAMSWFAFALANVAFYSLEYALGPETPKTLALVQYASQPALLAAWTMILWKCAPEDLEQKSSVFKLKWSPAQVTEQMDAFNRSLVRLLKV